MADRDDRRREDEVIMEALREVRRERRLPSYHDDPDEVSEVSILRIGTAKLPIPKSARRYIGLALAVLILAAAAALLATVLRQG